MHPDIIKELGLSPLWRKKTATSASTTTAVTTTAAAAPQPTPLPPSSSPQAAKPATEYMNWQQLKVSVEKCQRCPLHENRRLPAFGCGFQQAQVMFIGEGPGEEEDRRGEPFVGRAGQLLDLMLHSIRLSRRDTVYIANIVKCRPPGNRNPTVQEAQQCLPYLERQIALVQPALLIALGKVAATYLLNTDSSIAQLRQKIHEYKNIPLVVTYHPAYLLRSPQEKRKSWDDLKFIRQLLTESD